MSIKVPPFLRFIPIYQTRVWGGRVLQSRFGRDLPDEENPYGESWEISAREEADSEVSGGPLAGKTLRELWADDALKPPIFGDGAPEGERFPLLCKILDARDKLSIQVHPPAAVADALGGEPKTEVWYIAHAEPGAELYVGVEQGVDEDSFRASLEEGTAENSVHAIPVVTGQHIFIPSGRLHAIGAGLLIYEIQQNSDTTYRVYDWNRVGLDGKPRDLHIEESLQCIDFTDVTPTMDDPKGTLLCECEHFRLERHILEGAASVSEVTKGRFAILTVVGGTLEGEGETFGEGDFLIVPAAAGEAQLAASAGGAEVLLTTWP
ncbi:MAG: type I phosphomannose isomerase catalytic subunit [Verrucomicrobiota bacterium]